MSPRAPFLPHIYATAASPAGHGSREGNVFHTRSSREKFPTDALGLVLIPRRLYPARLRYEIQSLAISKISEIYVNVNIYRD